MSYGEILIILFLVCFSIIYGVTKQKNKFEIMVVTILIIINIVFIYIIYNNNISLGYSEGILYGNNYGVNTYDDFKYYNESRILYDHWENGDFGSWIRGELPNIEFYVNGKPGYGNYNFFVIILTILRKIGFSNVKELLLLKLIFTVLTYYLVLDVSNYYNKRNSNCWVLLIFALFPSNLAINSVLLRDNIIILLTVYFIYNYLIKNENMRSIKFAIILIIIFVLRAYLPIILIFLIIVNRFTKYKDDIVLRDSWIVFVIMIALVLVKAISDKSLYLSMLYSNINLKFGAGIIGILKLIIKSMMVLVMPIVKWEYLSVPSIYIKLLWIAPIIYMLISVLFIIKFLKCKFYKSKINERYLMKNTIIFSFFLSLLVMGKDGFLESRITLMWIWMIIIVIFGSKHKRSEKNG